MMIPIKKIKSKTMSKGLRYWLKGKVWDGGFIQNYSTRKYYQPGLGERLYTLLGAAKRAGVRTVPWA